MDMSISNVMKAGIVAALVVLAGISSASARGERKLNGVWILADGQGVLVIRGSSWHHPKYGAGTIRKGRGSATYEVFYNKHEGIRCAYRILTIADGQLLVLEVADETQSPDFCPRGKLSRADR
jgi:hypothetical protein